MNRTQRLAAPSRFIVTTEHGQLVYCGPDRDIALSRLHTPHIGIVRLWRNGVLLQSRLDSEADYTREVAWRRRNGHDVSEYVVRGGRGADVAWLGKRPDQWVNAGRRSGRAA